MLKSFFLILYIFFSMGCAAKAKIVNGEIILKCLGSCEAKFKDGTKIKKSIVTFPNLKFIN